jgi:hypothetical protein
MCLIPTIYSIFDIDKEDEHTETPRIEIKSDADVAICIIGVGYVGKRASRRLRQSVHFNRLRRGITATTTVEVQISDAAQGGQGIIPTTRGEVGWGEIGDRQSDARYREVLLKRASIDH